MLPRKMLLAVTVISALALISALVSQHYFDMLPCPWCILQRMLYLVIMLLALLGLAVPLLTKAFLGLVGFTSVAGAAVAIYQITVAAETLSCDQTMADQIITSSGLDVVAPWFFGVYASCMDAVVDLFGLEYAVWSLMLFIALAFASAITLWVNCRSQQNQG